MRSSADFDGPIVVGSVLPASVGEAEAAVSGAPAGCALLELRADRLGPDDVATVVRRSPRPLIVTSRAREDGGAFDGSEAERERCLRAALDAGARFVDLEGNRPLANAILDVPSLRGRIILSHHGGPARGADLHRVYRGLAARPAAVLKIVPAADGVDENLALRDLLALARRDGRRLAAFASGMAGATGRLLAPSWGSWATYASLARGAETAEGQLSAHELLETFDVLAIGPETRLFALVGHRVASSPSPAMHAAGYEDAGIDARYLAVETDSYEDFLTLGDRRGGVGFEAFGVTIPFKERAALDCRAGDETAAAAGTVNTVLLSGARPVGYSTDGAGALACISRRIDPRGRTAAVLGAGGTGRAVAHALLGAGARVTLFNRDPSRGEAAARRLGCAAAPAGRLGGFEWEILVNATPQGGDGARFLDPKELRGRVVLDAVYAPRSTALVSDARERGIVAIDGVELLAQQGILQFARMTGRAASLERFLAEAVQHLRGPMA